MKKTLVEAKITLAEKIEKEESDAGDMSLDPALQSFYYIEFEIEGKKASFKLPIRSWLQFYREKGNAES